MPGIRNLERKSDLEFRHIKATLISNDWFRWVDITDHAVLRMRETYRYGHVVGVDSDISELRKKKREVSSMVIKDIISCKWGAIEFAGHGGVHLYVASDHTMYVFTYDHHMVLKTLINLDEVDDKTKPIWHAKKEMSRMSRRHTRVGLLNNKIRELEKENANLSGQVAGFKSRRKGILSWLRMK